MDAILEHINSAGNAFVNFAVPMLVQSSVLIVVLLGLRTLFSQKLSASKAETVQALFTYFLVTFVVLTTTGAWFRGKGMTLKWPWMMD